MPGCGPTVPSRRLAATLYGPCEVKAEIAGTPVRIEEQTSYPYSGDVEITLHPAKPVAFCLWLRNPAWSKETKIVCPGADIRQVGGFWQVRKSGRRATPSAIHFDQTIREVPAINGEVALQYGPLLYVLPVKGEMQTVRTYDKPGFKDYYVSLAKGADAKFGLPPTSAPPVSDLCPRRLKERLPISPSTTRPSCWKAHFFARMEPRCPLRSFRWAQKNAQLRRVTFPIGSVPRMMTGFEAEKARLLGVAKTYADPAASGESAVGFIGNMGDGIECQSPLLTGQQLKIRYAALNTATLTLEMKGKRHKIYISGNGRMEWRLRLLLCDRGCADSRKRHH